MRFSILGLASSFGLAVACGSGGASDPVDSDTLQGSDTAPISNGEIGDSCWTEMDCKSHYCDTYVSVPASLDASCQQALPLGQIRLRFTVHDFFSYEPLEGVLVHIVGGMAAAVSPLGAFDSAPVKLISGKDGRLSYDAATELTSQPVGLVALMQRGKYAFTGAALVAKDLATESGLQYPPGSENHDVMVIGEALLAKWSKMIERADPSAEHYLPLGKKGGAICRVMYIESGRAVKGATISPAKNAATSTSKVYYLNEAMNAFDASAVSENGFIVILRPGLMERFVAQRNGVNITVDEAIMASTAGIAYTDMFMVRQGDDPGYAGP